MRPHDGRAIPTFLRQALADRPLTVFGDGGQTRSFCYVDDLIRGIIAPRGLQRAPAGQHRQPRRVHAAGARADGRRGHGLAQRDRLRGAADRRSQAAPSRHRAGARAARLGAAGRASRRAAAHDRGIRRRGAARPHGLSRTFRPADTFQYTWSMARHARSERRAEAAAEPRPAPARDRGRRRRPRRSRRSRGPRHGVLPAPETLEHDLRRRRPPALSFLRRFDTLRRAACASSR